MTITLFSGEKHVSLSLVRERKRESFLDIEDSTLKFIFS